MLMVVFGAGASYDSIDVKPPDTGNPGWVIDEEFRPPLAKDLFGFRGLFADAMARFARLHPIVPLLRHAGTRNIETVLRELQDEAEVYPERRRQLMAVRYYLHFVIWECELKWKSVAKQVTNYKSLLDQINRWRKPDEMVALVTFNYDTLLEDAMSVVGPTLSQLDDYISGNTGFKIFKLHGSINWARLVKGPIPADNPNAWWFAADHIDRAADLEITDEFIRTDERPCGSWNGKVRLVPAIAIPVEKKASFECPQTHLRELERLLPQVDKIALIGWRATENHFLELLARHLKGPIKAQVVAGERYEGGQIAAGLDDGCLRGKEVRWGDFESPGFTNFVISRGIERILGPTAPA